jgi:hypothetical protein
MVVMGSDGETGETDRQTDRRPCRAMAGWRHRRCRCRPRSVCVRSIVFKREYMVTVTLCMLHYSYKVHLTATAHMHVSNF